MRHLMQDNTSVDVGELDNGLPFPHHVLSNMSEVHAGMTYSMRNKRYAYATNSTTADPWLYLYRWDTSNETIVKRSA